MKKHLNIDYDADINDALALTDKAKTLYFAGYRVTHIAKKLCLKRSTVQSWKQRGNWDQVEKVARIEANLDQRLNLLINKNDKEGKDYKEIDLLMRQIEKLEAIKLKSDISQNKNNKKNKVNYFSAEQIALLQEIFEKNLFDYQKKWWNNRQRRIRNILKPRQIGATWYFAREALIDCLTRGHNKIFLSASKLQAHQFRSYIISLAAEADIELKGDPLIIKTDDFQAEMRFLGTNSKTAQSYHGDLYIDEYFWINRFVELRKVASAMAAHKQWTTTYFSTPSAITHEAYEFWTGGLFNKGRAKTEHIEIDLNHRKLQSGSLGADGQWRHRLTILDAMREGCNLFDLEQLKREYSPAEFEQLFLCEFIDDSSSVFSFEKMQRCLVDSWDEWKDFKPHASKPLEDIPVAIGIDPAKARDGCAVAVLAIPTVKGGKFRVVEHLNLEHGSSELQAQELEKLFSKYNVRHCEIDETGLGIALSERVAKIFPQTKRINYNLSVKNYMVAKALEVVDAGRLEFDASAKDIISAFIAIKKSLTASGSQTTYTSDRKNGIGHADKAWAIMHALNCENLASDAGGAAQTTSYLC